MITELWMVDWLTDYWLQMMDQSPVDLKKGLQYRVFNEKKLKKFNAYRQAQKSSKNLEKYANK